MKKYIVLALIFYSLIVFQTSFLVHFKFLDYLPNIAIVFFVLLNLFEERREKSGLIMSFVAGFILDVFSGKPFGFYTAILLTTSLIIKFVIKKYFRLGIDANHIIK
ncbi:MAG: rod shape-determining protein MreD [bacterium]|nr:rod shape-determining protein MreD [bacterium]